MENLVTIKKFDLIGEDDRGLTASFSLVRKQDNFIFITRKAESISGNTFHEGKTAATNPKIFVLLAGEIFFSYRKIGELQHYSCEVIAPAIIEVSPFVTHSVKAITDMTILECNSLADIQHDKIRESVEILSA